MIALRCGLVEGAIERIIEDVVAVVDDDWEMVAAIFVLELDAVRGVVGIGNFTVYVSDGDGCHGTGKRKAFALRSAGQRLYMERRIRSDSASYSYYQLK